MSIKTVKEMRTESINKIKLAYENKELGFQRRAKNCEYYNEETDSYCAIGVLFKHDEGLRESLGNYFICTTMDNWGLDTFKGLTRKEALTLQEKHDILIGGTSKPAKREEEFKDYLYSL